MNMKFHIMIILSTMIQFVFNQSPTKVWRRNITTRSDSYRRFEIPGISNFTEMFCRFLNLSVTQCSCDIIPELCHAQKAFTSHNIGDYSKNNLYKRLSVTTIIYASVATLASVFGVIGNLAVLGFQHRWSSLSSCKLHIAELAVVNLIFSIVQLVNTIPLYWTNSWVYSLFMCKLLRSLLEIGSLLTSGFIQIIAYERYKLVVTPIRSQIFNRRYKHSLVIINIAVVVATVIPYATTLNIEEYSGRCVMFHGEGQNTILPYNLFVITLYSLVPICILSTFLLKMMLHLSGKEHLSAKQCIRGKLRKRNRHIMNITLLILSLFILCTLPTRAITVYMETSGYEKSTVNQYLALTLISYFTYPLQSTLNPILYSVIAKNWRKDAKRSLTVKFESLRESLL